MNPKIAKQNDKKDAHLFAIHVQQANAFNKIQSKIKVKSKINLINDLQ